MTAARPTRPAPPPEPTPLSTGAAAHLPARRETLDGASFVYIEFRHNCFLAQNKKLYLPEKPVVFVVGPNPEPYDVTVIQHSESAVIVGYPN